MFSIAIAVALSVAVTIALSVAVDWCAFRGCWLLCFPWLLTVVLSWPLRLSCTVVDEPLSTSYRTLCSCPGAERRGLNASPESSALGVRACL